MTLARNQVYYGSEAPLPEQRPLRAGPLQLLFEEGDLRYIRRGDAEILRRVYVAVRDRNWGTVPARLSHLHIEESADSFRISYDAEHRQDEVDFAWKATIAGDADGSIAFVMEGVARSTFLRNRIGFCVLHPAECAGLPCTVEKADGTVERSAFPRFISPRQPFMEMRAITHEATPGARAEARFEGDMFEMEDQRNWIDASYKTYCPPISLPFPVEIAAGTTIRQSVTLRLHEQPIRVKSHAATGDRPLTLEIGADSGRELPRLGLGMASHGQPLAEQEVRRLRALHPAHLRADVRMAEPAWGETLRRAAGEARALGAQLAVALHLTDDAERELAELTRLLEPLQPPVAAWLVFHAAEKATPERWARLARKYLARYGAPIGAGTDANFTELNRARPPIRFLDCVTYSINPQVHAFDNASLTECLAAIPATVASARQFCGGLPLHVSPVTLRPRFNPDATGPDRAPGPGELPATVDARQMSLYGAGWTLGSLKSLAESKVASVTFYETTGWRGVMETAGGSPLPEAFPSLPGAVFPLYHALADAGEFAGATVLPTVSSDPLKLTGLALRRGDGMRVLLANLTHQPQQATVRGLCGPVRVRLLDETNALAAMQEPEAFRAQAGETVAAPGGALALTLKPYALARLDTENTEEETECEY